MMDRKEIEFERATKNTYRFRGTYMNNVMSGRVNRK